MQPDDFLSENSAPFLGKDVDATAQENTTPEDAAFNVGVTVDAMLDHLTKGDSYKPKPVDITSDKNAGLGVRPYIVGAEGTATQSIEAYELSGELGVSVGMAAALPDFYKDTRASRTIENNALLSGWAKDSKNAPIAKEYAQELLNGFNASAEVMKQAGWAPRDYDPSSGMAPEIWELLEATRMRAVAGIKEEGEVYNLIGSFAAGIQEIFASAFGAVGYAGNAIENAFTPGELTKEEQLKQAENSFWLRLAEQGHESAAKARPQYDRSKVLQFASDVAEVAPQLAAQLGTGLLTSGSSLPVQVGAQSALMAPQLFESQTRSLIEKGVSPDAAMGWGALTALIEMPLEFIGQKKLFRLGDIRKATGEQAVKDVATTFVAEPLTEGLQGIQEKAVEHVAVGIEEGKTAGEIYSGFVKDLPNILGDSAYDAVLMLPFAFLGAARHISAIRDGKAFNSSMDATRAAWEPIKEKFKNPDLIDGAVKASGINGSVYMSGEDAYTLYQTHPDLEQAFGVSLENVQTASDMGQMVELDASRLISRLSPEQYEQTMDKISHTGAGVATVADFQAERERVLEATEKVFKEDSEFRKEAGRLREELTRLYRESENVKKSAAAAGDNVKAYVDSHIAMFKRLAVMSSGQTGEAPSSVLKRLGARTGLSGQDRNEMYQAAIEKEVKSLKGEGGELYQSSPDVDSDAFKEWFGDSQEIWRDRNGSPLLTQEVRRNKFDIPTPILSIDMYVSSGEKSLYVGGNSSHNFATVDEAVEFFEQNGYVLKERRSYHGKEDATLVHVKTQEYVDAEKGREEEEERKNWSGTRPIFVRYGKLPEGGRSKNWAQGTFEKGVSVFRGEVSPKGKFRALPDGNVQALAASSLRDRKLYIVEGHKVGIGSDGEPVLRNAQIVGAKETGLFRLTAESKEFGRQLSEVKKSKVAKSLPMLRDVPMVLQMVGIVDKNGVIVSPNLLETAMKKERELVIDTLKQIPVALSDPIAIFRAGEESVVVLLDLKGKSGGMVVIPVILRDNASFALELDIADNSFLETIESQITKNSLYLNLPRIGAWNKDLLAFIPEHEVLKKNDLIEKWSENSRYYQSSNNQETLNNLSDPLGALRVSDNKYLITLFKDANLSTLLHETGHIFLEEMERIKDLGLGDAQFIADYKAIHEWWSRFDEEATFRAEYDARLKNKPNFDGKKFEELTPEERAKARKIVEKEYFARGFEAYLLEGKAPAPELDGAFKRFRKWLLQLYVDVSRALGVELNDNIRGVFDRMLASDLEIERAAFNDEMLSAGIHAEKLSLSPEELAQMNRLQGAVKEQAVRILTEQRGKSLQARKALWRREAKEEYGANPVNTPLRMVYKDGYKLDPEAVKAYLGDDGYKLLHKKLGPGAFEAGGNDLETLALKLAYDFPDDKNLVNSAERAADGLADTLLHVPSEASFVKDYVDSMEKEFSASVNPEEALYETEEAARLAFKMGDYAARKAGKTNVSDETIARVAFDLMNSMPTRRAISFKQTFNDMKRASARWGKALAAGDFVKAFEANLQYRVNLELYKMARNNSDTLKKAGKKLNSFLRSKVVKGDEGSDAKYAASWISQKFSMRPAQKVDATLAEGRSVETIANWLKELEAEKYPLAIPDWILTGPAQRAKDLTWEQTGELLDTLSGIIEVGKTRNTVLLDGRRVELAEAVNSATSEILEKHKIKFDDPREQGIIATAINKVDMLHTKVENLLEILDGKPMGTNWKLLYRPVREGVNWLSKANKRLSKILMSKTEGFEQYSASERLNMSSKKFFVQEVGKSFTKEQAIMIAANMGTESNLDRLLSGEGWTIEQAQAVTNSILTDARDWRLVRSIWKSFEEFRDEAFDVNKRVTGIRPKPVSGIAVQTPFGEIQGGYFRISYDNRTVPADVQERLDNASSIQAMTETGQYKERAAKGLQGARLQLDFGVIEFRLNQLLADIAFREAGINVSKILKNKKYMDTIQKTIGVDGYNTLTNWLKDSINEQVQKSWVDSFLRWGRISATAVNMGFKITTILQQPLGLLQGVDRIGLGNMTKGLFAVYFGGGELPGSPEQMRGIKSRIGWMRSKSAFMDSRMGNYDRDMADAIRALDKSVSPDNLLDMALAKTGLLPATRTVQKNMFLPIALAQFYGVDVIVWAGAYQKGIKDFHGDEAKAVEYADQAVRMTQGSGDKLDLSGIQRGPELVKLLTTFYSYFNVLYNMTAMRVKDVAVKRDVASVANLARSFVLLYLIPSLLGELLSGRGPDDDDDWLDWAAVKLASYGMGTVVGVRNFSSVLEGYEVQFMPSERGVDAASSFLSEISKAMRDDKKSKPEKLAKYGARTLGYAFRLPEGQAEITIGAMLEYLNGTNEDAEIRDLFFKKKK